MCFRQRRCFDVPNGPEVVLIHMVFFKKNITLIKLRMSVVKVSKIQVKSSPKVLPCFALCEMCDIASS